MRVRPNSETSVEPERAVDRPYGRSLLPLWQIEAGTRFINHGAFGATPRAIAEHQAGWRQRMEANTARFFMLELPGLLRDTAAAVAPFVGVAPDRLAFVENASAGTATVLRSLDFAPGDEIVVTDHGYNAVRNAVLHVAERSGARLVEAPVALPVTDPAAVVEAVLQALGKRTRLVIVDHVTSGSATQFPVAEIVAHCHERGIMVLVDGAHAPGMVDLDVDAIGADWYVGNCHKWLCAPKGSAFLAVAADRPQAGTVHPLVISHAYGQGFPAEFDKVGSRDPSAWLTIPAAIAFHEEMGGAALRRRNRALAATVGATAAADAGTVLAAAPALSHAMAAIRVPGALPADRATSFLLRDILYDRHGVEAAVTSVAGVLFVRLSVHAYNEEADYAGLGAAIAAAAAEAEARVMIRFMLQRLWQSAIVLLSVSILAFLMFRFLGDPVVQILGAQSTGLQREQLRQELGLDGPLLFQFFAYLGQMLSGDFGISYRLGEPVARTLAQRMPATIELAVIAMVIAVVIGIPAGVYASLRRQGAGSRAIMGLSLVGISMPSFFMGMLLIYVFSVELNWLPSFGRGQTVDIGGWQTGLLTVSGLKALIMPAITLSAFQVAMIMRLVRAEMIEVLRTDFIRFARARGLPRRTVHLRHALGNTLVPVITIIGLQLGSTIGFAVVTETVFQWPGLGLLFIQSVSAADVPVLAAFLMLIALVFVVINIVVDLAYFAIDPRLKMSGREGRL